MIRKIRGKKGAEIWQIVLIILALLFLLIVIMLYSGWGDKIKDLLGVGEGLMQ